ncbi:MAG TPA: Hsp20/alpha crystallin family protein [Methanoregula sp.]|nr:Hsp20/alpha crystallin family protein [Methanoregula sp.]
MENMRAELENMFQLASSGSRLLPAGGVTDRMLPALRSEFRVDVREHDDEVIVVADLPGVEKDNVSIQLLNPGTLEISCERKGEKEGKTEGYYVRERMYGSMQRMIAMPADVTEKDAKASFKNGVLEVTFNKSKISPKSRIEIE